MKRLLICCIALLLVVAALPAKPKFVKTPKTNKVSTPSHYPLVSIQSLQYCSPDSLKYVDSVTALNGPASPATGFWTKQTSAYYKAHTGGVKDTVEIVGQIIVPPKYITFTSVAAYNFTLRDTSAHGSGAWASIFVRPANASGEDDTLALYNAHILDYVPGDVIRIRGYVDEYPTNTQASYTEFVPVAAGFVQTDDNMGSCVEYIDTWSVPPVDTVSAGDFMTGAYTSAGKNIKSITGEQWEDCYVELHDLTVVSAVSGDNGTFAMQDALGNEISDMDGSKFFTKRTGTPQGSPLEYRDPSSTYALPPIGQEIKSIRGYIATNSGTDANRGYRIYPVFRDDILYGKVVPAINTHRRNPIALTPTDSAIITVKSYQQVSSDAGGSPVQTVALHYSVDNGVWRTLNMVGPNLLDSTWRGAIPPQAADAFVRYYITSTDTTGSTALYANAAGGSAQVDTTQGYFFYNVRNRALTIHDVQYTPFSNGTSSLFGAVVTVTGVVTADTNDLNINITGSGATTPWYIQTGNEPWNGIWVYGINSQLKSLQKGDSISVYGVVQEYNDGLTGSVGRVTRIYDSTVTVISSGRTVPAPIVTTTGTLASLTATNGSLYGEPYEGMLVRVNNVTITNLSPVYSD